MKTVPQLALPALYKQVPSANRTYFSPPNQIHIIQFDAHLTSCVLLEATKLPEVVPMTTPIFHGAFLDGSLFGSAIDRHMRIQFTGGGIYSKSLQGPLAPSLSLNWRYFSEHMLKAWSMKYRSQSNICPIHSWSTKPNKTLIRDHVIFFGKWFAAWKEGHLQVFVHESKTIQAQMSKGHPSIFKYNI